MIEIKWLGRGGQGGFTAARMLGVCATLFEDRYAIAFPSFGPERRGAPVYAFTKIDDIKITDRSESNECDYLVILDDGLFNIEELNTVKSEGTVIINSIHPEKYSHYNKKFICIDATGIAIDILKKPITNTAMFGALVGASDIVSTDSSIKAIEYTLPPAISSKNIDVFKETYKKVREGV